MAKERRIQVSANVGADLHAKAVKKRIGWTEALEIGIKILLAKRKRQVKKWNVVFVRKMQGNMEIMLNQ